VEWWVGGVWGEVWAGVLGGGGKVTI